MQRSVYVLYCRLLTCIINIPEPEARCRFESRFTELSWLMRAKLTILIHILIFVHKKTWLVLDSVAKIQPCFTWRTRQVILQSHGLVWTHFAVLSVSWFCIISKGRGILVKINKHKLTIVDFTKRKLFVHSGGAARCPEKSFCFVF